MEEYRGLHHIRVQAKEREWQRKQANLFQHQELQRYYHQQLFIYHLHLQRLEIFASNLDYLTRTAPTATNTIRDINKPKPSHFSFFSYNIHDKDAFGKSISRTEEKPEKKKILPRNRWGSVKKEKVSSSKDQHSYTLFPPN